jgi:hypothetical protein
MRASFIMPELKQDTCQISHRTKKLLQRAYRRIIAAGFLPAGAADWC